MKLYHFVIIMALAFSLQAEPVKASKFGFDPADATECLQKAIDSGARQILVDQTGNEWLVRPLKLRGDQELIIGKDVTVRAKPGEYKGRGDTMMTADGIKNLIIRGESGAVLKMNRKDYWDLKNYPHSEWRNTIALRGAANVEIRDLTFEESGGDGIYITGNRKQPMSKDLKFTNLTIRGSHRQGISVISAENMLIKNCRFQDTKGTPPQAGIDFEPGGFYQRLINCAVEDCSFTGNAAPGLLIHIVALSNATRPVSIDIRNCRFENNNGGISIEASGYKPAVTGQITISDCVVVNKDWQTLKLNNLEETGATVTFKNVVLDNRGNGKPPIAISTSKYVDFGNLHFGNLKIIDDRPRSPIVVQGMGAAGLTTVTGNISVQVKNQPATKFNLARLIKEYPPHPELKNFTSLPFRPEILTAAPGAKGVATKPLNLRGSNTFVQYVPAGGEVEIRFKTKPIRGIPNVPVTVKDSTGIVVDEIKLGPGETVYKLHSNNGGVHSFLIRDSYTAVTVTSNAPGQGFAADAGRLRMYQGNSNLFFVVPGDAPEVKVEVYADEPVGGALTGPDGKVYDKVNQMEHGIKILYAKRTPTPKPEIWQVKLFNVSEDHGIRLGAPLQPVVYTDPANCLITRPDANK